MPHSSDIVQIPEDFYLSDVVQASTALPIAFPGAANNSSPALQHFPALPGSCPLSVPTPLDVLTSKLSRSAYPTVFCSLLCDQAASMVHAYGHTITCMHVCVCVRECVFVCVSDCARLCVRTLVMHVRAACAAA